MVFVNTTFAAQLTACLPHADRKVTESLSRQYPSCWTGRFGLDLAGEVTRPHVPRLLLVGAHDERVLTVKIASNNRKAAVKKIWVR
jgi:hypothetical protein